MKFEGDPPKGWIGTPQARGYWRPTKRSQEGKKLREQMENLPLAGNRVLTHEYFDVEDFLLEGRRILWLGLEKFQDVWVLAVPTIALDGRFDLEKFGDGLTELKMSEYYRMKEAEAEARKAEETEPAEA